MKNIPFVLIFIIFSLYAFAQPEKQAKDLFEKGNYIDAIKQYQILLKKDPKNIDYNYNAALCYLRGHLEKSKALSHLEIVAAQPKVETEVILSLAQAYHFNHKFDEAISQYQKYKQLKGKEAAKIDRYIEQCNNGKELTKYPIDVTFTNVGKDINTEFADYYPFISANEKFMVFTSRRKGNTGNALDYDGYYTSDIYISEVKNGVWTKAKNIGANLNTAQDEQVVGLTSNGKTMLIYIDHKEAVGDIYYSENTGKGFVAPIPFGDNVNTESVETSASITSDGNILIFTSNKSGGQGGTDIYMSKRLPNGEWGPSFNLGPKINSKYNEEFPHLSEDNRTLYFCSEGHNSMGGYDLFRSELDTITNQWKGPRNLGFPINTAEDNLTFGVSASNRDGYVSAVRPEGFGDYDIYKVTFNKVEERQTVLRGKLLTSDSVKTTDAVITVIDLGTNEPRGEYVVNPKTSKYVIILPAGKYRLEVNVPGYKPYAEQVNLMDKADFKPEILKNIVLEKPGVPAAPKPQPTGAKPTAVPVQKKQ